MNAAYHSLWFLLFCLLIHGPIGAFVVAPRPPLSCRKDRQRRRNRVANVKQRRTGSTLRAQHREEPENVSFGSPLQQQHRRQVLRLASAVLTTLPATNTLTTWASDLPSPSVSLDENDDATVRDTIVGETITIPLQWVPRLSAYVVYYAVGGERFAAIIDTGSPFLVVPNYCNRQTYGCFDPQQSRPSGLAPTVERFDNNQGPVEWRVAPFSFVNAAGSMMGPRDFVFGVLSESLMDGPGGVFLGLIRDTDAWIRPSFLGQTNVNAMMLGLKGNSNDSDSKEGKTLTLYTQSPLRQRQETTKAAPTDKDAISLVRDLNRKYGDPVIHYTVRATGFRANGNNVIENDNESGKKQQQYPIYVIIDTGVTGMVVSRELLDQRYASARRGKEKSLWGQVEIDLRTDAGHTVTLTAQKPVTTPLADKPWPKFNKAYLIVVGLAFLDGHDILIDMEAQKVQIT